LQHKKNQVHSLQATVHAKEMQIDNARNSLFEEAQRVTRLYLLIYILVYLLVYIGIICSFIFDLHGQCEAQVSLAKEQAMRVIAEKDLWY
jgi:hypothetical protein